MAVVLAVVATALSSTGASAAGRGRVRHEMLVSTAWLGRHLEDRGLAVLHVGRARDGYDAGHVPGARFVALKDVAVERDGVANQVPPVADLVALLRRLGLDDTRHLVLYDDEGGLIAARVFVVLDYLGLGDRAALLDGQMARWRTEARPLATATPAVTPSTFEPHLRPEVIVTLDAVRDLSWAATQGAGGAALLDARPEPQYAGADPTDDMPRPGHIPGAASLYWTRTLVSKEDPVLRPPDELRALLAGAGATPDDLVVTYCRTGVQASFTYFVARYLGYDARLYDGSFSEWSGRADTPVAGPPVTGPPAAPAP
jgi:thiosulfate/3-mercaptopyruvate sulfurtransferase